VGDVLLGKSWLAAAEVAVGQVLRIAVGAGQESVPERGVGDEPDAEFAQERQDVGLNVAGPQGVLGLHRGQQGQARRLSRGA